MNLTSIVVFNGFWIVGLAILLAAYSYYSYEAAIQEQKLREYLPQTSFQQVALVSGVFVAIGLAGTSQAVWETIIWAIFALLTAGLAITNRKKIEQ